MNELDLLEEEPIVPNQDSYEEDGASAMSEQEILEIFQDLRDESEEEEPYREIAKMIECICANRPLTELVTFANFSRKYTEPTVTLQLLYNLVLTWASIIVKSRPSVYAVANTDSLESTMAAKIATKFIEYFETEESVADKWHQSALWAAQHGTAMMYICYDPLSKRVRWQPLSVFDCYLENRANHEDIDWALIRSYVKPYEARALLKQVDPEAALPSTTQYTDAMGIQRKGVEKWSLYIRPNARVEKGLYACIIDGTVVEAMDYQNIFPEEDGNGEKAILPIVFWSCRSVRGSTLGNTWATDVSDTQVSINALMSKINRDALNARQMEILPSTLRDTDLIDEQNARIYFDPANADAAKMIRYNSPAPLDPNVQNTLKQDIEAMYLASGISQTTTGDSSASQSGKAMYYQQEMDNNKHSDAFKNFEVAQRNAWELTLKLVQKYYTEPRQLKITGTNALAFSAADIAGVTVKLEHRTEKESARSTKLENAKADMANGFAGREALLDAAPSALTSGMRVFAQELIDRYLSGQDVNVTAESLAPEVMIAVIDENSQQAMLEKDLEKAMALDGFKQQYLKMIAGAQEPDAPAQGGAPVEASALPDANTPAPEAPLPELGV